MASDLFRIPVSRGLAHRQLLEKSHRSRGSEPSAGPRVISGNPHSSSAGYVVTPASGTVRSRDVGHLPRTTRAELGHEPAEPEAGAHAGRGVAHGCRLPVSGEGP